MVAVAVGPRCETRIALVPVPLATATPQTGATTATLLLMRTSVVTFDTRAKQRFYSLAQQARLHARPGEAAPIGRVVRAVELGEMTLKDAHALLAHLRREQQQRAAA